MTEWMTTEASLIFSFGAYWEPTLCHSICWVQRTRWWILVAEKAVTQAETTLPPNFCEIPPPSGFATPLNILWCKGNSILEVNMLKPKENQWLHKLTLRVKHSIRMRTWAVGYLKMLPPISSFSLPSHSQVSGAVYQSVSHQGFCCWPSG